MLPETATMVSSIIGSGCFMTRRKAFLLNSLAFAVVALALTGFALWLNPGPLFLANAAATPLLVTIGIALVVGPVLMLVLFRPGKKGLMVDVIAVIAMQVLVWGTGAWLLWQDRPGWLVIAVDRIETVRIGEVDGSQVSDPALRHPSPGSPLLVAAHMPDDADRQRDIMFEAVSGGPDIDRLPELYESPGPADAAGLQERDRTNDALPEEATAMSRGNGDIVLLPLIGHGAELLVAFDLSRWEIVDWWNVSPWKKPA